MKNKITKEMFVETINILKEQNDKDRKFGKALGEMFDTYPLSYSYQNVEAQLIKLLQVQFDDDHKDSWIDYYIYELEFGSKYKKGCAKYKNGKNINLSTAAYLYDFLIENLNDKNTI